MNSGDDDSCISTPVTVLYHYTGADGLLGIVSNQHLWATAIEFLNDAQELVYAHGELRAAINDRLERLPDPGNESDGHTPERRTHRLKQILIALDRVKENYESGLFVSSLSEDRDSLSQWRAYGGYAIGFRLSDLDAMTFDSVQEANGIQSPISLAFKLEKIRYGIDDQVGRELAGIAEVLDDARGGVGVALRGIAQMRRSGLPTLATIKHPSFAIEREWRLISSGPISTSLATFRSGPLGVIPYIPVPFDRRSIVEVIVGPSTEPDLRRSAVKQCLIRNGFRLNPPHEDGVRVSGSESPLRI